MPSHSAPARPAPSLLLLLAALCGAAFVPDAAHAEEPDMRALEPRLVEIEELYGALDRSAGEAPETPEWVRVRQPVDMEELERRPLVRTLPGLRVYDLENPPRDRSWIKTILYPVAGLPRDLVDGFFGVVGYVPLLNLPLTGLLYETVPTQVLMRHPDDWHGWGGKANDQGHGWVDGAAWGFFSNLHETEFARVDERELEKRRLHNRLVRERIDEANQAVRAHNAEAARKREEYLAGARRAFAEGAHQEVVARLSEYVLIDPANRSARAMLGAALVQSLPETPDRAWAEARLTNLLRTSSRDALIALKDALREAERRHPEQADIPRFLVWVNVRLQSFRQAQTAAERLAKLEPSNVKAAFLQFEAALAANDPANAEQALRRLTQALGEDAPKVLDARGRLALLQRRPDEAVRIYEGLVETDGNDARTRYLLAIARVQEALETGRYPRGKVLRGLKHAERLAETPGEAIFYGRARRAAELLRI